MLDKLSSTLERLDGFLDKAEDEGDAREFVTVAAELRKELELLAKLQGDLDQEGQVNLHLNAEWVELRALIIGALEPHPQAMSAVRAALWKPGRVETNGHS